MDTKQKQWDSPTAATVVSIRACWSAIDTGNKIKQSKVDLYSGLL